MIKQKDTNRHHPLAWTVIAIVIALCAGIAYWGYSQNWWHSGSQSSNSDKAVTSTDKNAADIKSSDESSGKNSDNNQSNSTSRKTVQVAVSSSSVSGNTLEIRAFIIGVVEGDGTCTATLTKDGATVTSSSIAFIDATTSQCTPIDIGVSQFQEHGIWKLIVSYYSPTSIGSSSSSEVNI